MLLHQFSQFALLRQHREECTDKFVVIMSPPTIVNLKERERERDKPFPFNSRNKFIYTGALPTGEFIIIIHLVFVPFVILVLQTHLAGTYLVLQIFQQRQQILRGKCVWLKQLGIL